MKLRFYHNTIEKKAYKKTLYRYAFNEACNMLVRAGFYKTTQSAESSILRKIKNNLKNE